jgi:hypothetical protein
MQIIQANGVIIYVVSYISSAFHCGNMNGGITGWVLSAHCTLYILFLDNGNKNIKTEKEGYSRESRQTELFTVNVRE